MPFTSRSQSKPLTYLYTQAASLLLFFQIITLTTTPVFTTQPQTPPK